MPQAPMKWVEFSYEGPRSLGVRFREITRPEERTGLEPASVSMQTRAGFGVRDHGSGLVRPFRTPHRHPGQARERGADILFPGPRHSGREIVHSL